MRQLSRGKCPWGGERRESKKSREDGGDDPSRLQGEKPDAPEEAVEIAVDALGKIELRQQRVHRLAERLRNPVERADAGWVGTGLVLAQKIRAEERPGSDIPLRQFEEAADLTDAAPEGPIEAFRAMETVGS
jgi:hypothetical protein